MVLLFYSISEVYTNLGIISKIRFLEISRFTLRARFLQEVYYFRKLGCYPTAVLADKIYQTYANKVYCKLRDIRLSGLPLGRRRPDETGVELQRQMYKDSCQRNTIEGRNGVAKRRFGLDLIMSKLYETARTEAALVYTCHVNSCRRLARWLVRFFYLILSPPGFPFFQQTLLRELLRNLTR